MSKPEDVPMEPEDLDELDEAILDYLKEGRESGEPWGRGTPAVVRARLKKRGWTEEDLPLRQTINNRMKNMALAGHLVNIEDKGEYEFDNDPREENDE